MTRKKTTHEFDYYVLLFFGLAFIGWLWEVGLYLATEHAFINRGVYRGPYLPIYGAGGLALCLLLRPLRRKPVRVFLLSMALCSGLEYFTSWFLERLWGIRWWDYSGHAWNLNGRICLLGAVVFGLGGTGLVYLTIPPNRSGPGKVSVTVQEQLREFEACADSERPIPTGRPVRIIGLLEGNTLLVEEVEG